jgi:prephenate dehydrogenase
MKLALIGVGLIGGSLAAALRAARAVEKVVGFDTDAAALAMGRERGVLTDVAASAADAVRGADVVLVATPVGAVRATLAGIAGHLAPDAVVTDVGSTKCSVIADAAATLGPKLLRFVPAHPIAGGERPGVAYADAALFNGRLAITTPTEVTDRHALERVESLWRAAGARIERLAPDRHDRIFAAVSHLPHLLAFALVEMIAGGVDAEARFAHAGAGFRDFTRIAASSPEMWRDVCVANRGPLSDELRAYRARLERLQAAVDSADAAALLDVFASAAAARRAS